MPDRIRREFWDALLDPVSALRLDLETLQLVSPLSDLVAEQPERFLALPGPGSALWRQASMAVVQQRAASLEAPRRDELAALAAAVEGGTEAERLFAGLGDTWRQAFEAQMRERIEEWANRHGLPPEVWAEPVQAAPARRRSKPCAPGFTRCSMG